MRESNDSISENEKMILTGRVYPALQSCLDNRYKIIVGIFAFYAFILNSDSQNIKNNICAVKLIGSFTFSAFLILNSANYIVNSSEKAKLEKLNTGSWFSRNNMEIIFSSIALIFIWVAYKKF